jgi:RNA-directed DNA polymerase
VKAPLMLRKLRARVCACGSELDPEKTKIVYCQTSIGRPGTRRDREVLVPRLRVPTAQGDDRYGHVYVTLSPAVSRDTLKAMRQSVKGCGVGELLLSVPSVGVEALVVARQ